MRVVKLITVLAVMVSAAAYAGESKFTVENLPPSVVKTVPQCGDMEVDPDLKEITVTFSKDMVDGSWSVCHMLKEQYPDSRGDVFYKDERNFVFPVKLEPGRTYVVWFNTERFQNFRDTEGLSSVPYQLVFKTKDK